MLHLKSSEGKQLACWKVMSFSASDFNFFPHPCSSYISCHALTVHCTGQQLVRHSQKSFLQYICTLLKLSSLCCWHFFSTVWAGGLFASVHCQHLVGELLSTSAASPWHFSRTWILEGVNARGQVELISRFFSWQAKMDLEKHLFLHHDPGSWF